MNTALTHAEADLGDVRLHYVTAGEGPVVLLIHGWPQTWFMWRDVMPGLAQSFRVIAPDLRGLGDSSRPAAGYDKKTVSNDLWRLVHDVLGVRSLCVAGHDWGGPVAFSFAAQHRDAVRRMAIFDVSVPGDGTAAFFDNRWHHGLHWEADLPEALTAGREDIYLGHFYRKWGASPSSISDEAQREYLRTYRQAGAMRSGFNFYRAMHQDVRDNEAFLASAGKLAMPVLCWSGSVGRSRGQSMLDSWRRVASDVTGGIAEGCGHWICEERPAWVVEELTRFFEED